MPSSRSREGRSETAMGSTYGPSPPDPADEEDDEKPRPKRKRKKAGKKSSGTKIAAIAVGGVLLLAVVALVVVLVVRNKNNPEAKSDTPTDPPKSGADFWAPGGKTEKTIRNDPKWVRGPKARELLIGDWRDSGGEATVISPDGTFAEPSFFPQQPAKKTTYRFLDDGKLEITRPPNQFRKTDDTRAYE